MLTRPRRGQKLKKLNKPEVQMRASTLTVLFAICLTNVILASAEQEIAPTTSTQAVNWSKYEGYTGSLSCRECHARFHQLWSKSFHGLAMQPFTPELAREKLTPQKEDIVIEKLRYRAEFNDKGGWVLEKGSEGEKKYKMIHAMGGKNVYYFLTPMERGRLQTLPVAYDVRRKEWYDTAASGVRHFTDIRDEPINWKEWPYTFNTACFNCHVSQLSTNYDLKTDTYNTVWVEPGINCETCHGSGEEHIRVCREAPEGEIPKDLKIIIVKKFTEDQTNTMCAPCHAKMVPITTTFQPGDRYFDHYDLVTLEHRDFYPDGRDLGENYTYTLWRMSPCVKSGKLDCTHCHTSSGRYRFNDKDKANQACMPCHEKRIKDVAAHSHHPPESDASKCISCHMPMTEFARMRRSDHSMRPPMPAATIAFKSPNACNLCHTDKDAAWAERYVREWRKRDYQKPVLHVAGLIDAARKRDWSRLPAMLDYVTSGTHGEVFANSLIRLMRTCGDERKWPVFLKVLKDNSSPLLRASAAEILSDRLTPEAVDALLAATRDEYRLVRVRAVAALAAVPREMIKEKDRKHLDKALAEFKAAMNVRPDDALSHYNLGNFYSARREFDKAINSYKTSLKLHPDLLIAYVNASIAYNITGDNKKAEQSLRKALEIDSDNLAANLNLGMLLGEMGRMEEAEKAFRKALKADPESAPAAYNLGVILAKDRIDEAIEWCRKASELSPNEPKYSYTLAFYLRQKGDVDGAIRMLQQMIEQKTAYTEAYILLGQIYEEQKKTGDAIAVYRKALENEKLPERERYRFAARIRALSSR